MVDEDDDARRAPGWKRDPWQRFAARYWDGDQWTEHVVTAEKVRGLDSVPSTVTPPATPVPRPPAPLDPAAERTLPMDTVYPPRPGHAAAPAPPAVENTVWASVRGWPRWVPWTIAVIVALAIVGAAFTEPEDGNEPVSVVGNQATTLTPLATTTLPPATVAPATTAPVTTLPPTTVTTTAPATTRAPVATTVPPTSATTSSVFYANCDAVRAAGKAPLYQGQPGYRAALDRDSDGIACDVTGG